LQSETAQAIDFTPVVELDVDLSSRTWLPWPTGSWAAVCCHA
jgi:hypothetical protein